MLEYTADTVQTAKWIHFLSKPPRREGKLAREGAEEGEEPAANPRPTLAQSSPKPRVLVSQVYTKHTDNDKGLAATGSALVKQGP